ncbi:uncharacterized protein LOC128674209 [Plodia interpunctella]|uniref:uncharacterized protein LOC128674209 n=1 Tax=Plodia interpunctella TaxID=58824 RepID=UPI002367ADC6|nr:uncharacterized protein LOC128674209 [Plodia interpunctella]
MDLIMSLVLLLVCAQSHCEPLRDAVQRRSDVLGIYASEFAGGYEPMAFAAVPLHAPLPIVHIVSTAPLPITRYPPTQRQRPTSTSLTPAYSHHVSSYVQAPTSLATSYSRQTHYRPTYPQQSGTYIQHPEPYHPQSMTIIQKQGTFDHQPLYRLPNIYAASIPHPMNTEPTEAEDDAPTILYARPQPEGGYTYHRKPSKRRVPPKKREPVIIRVHKYRVVKGR